MRWNIGPSTSTPLTQPDTPPLPFSHPPIASSSRSPPPTCPMSNTASTTSFIPPSAKCPIDYEKSSPTGFNPLNSIPLGVSATTRAVNQVLDLPTDRETSTIPRPKSPIPDAEDEGPTWEYPSPQQFYNALVRKGWETPEESIEMVVQIHNFLNEMAWEEVMKWERRLPGGEFAQLAKFQGRPGELSPKARMHLWAGQLFPSRFNTMPPFDRHDWIVTRPLPSETPSPTQNPSSPPSGTTLTTRYVIDYYSAPPDEEGNPVFHLDVRPALDNLESINLRIKVGFEEWMKGERS